MAVMTNEMKLLMALCDALGFEVEETAEQKIPSGQILIPHDYKLTKKGETQQDVDQEMAKELLWGSGKELTVEGDKYILVGGQVFKRVNLDGQ